MRANIELVGEGYGLNTDSRDRTFANMNQAVGYQKGLHEAQQPMDLFDNCNLLIKEGDENE